MAVDYSKLLDGNSLKAIRSYIQTYSQPLNANLTSISALATNVTGLIKLTNGVASIDSNSYITSHLYRPINVNGVEKLANTSSTALGFDNSGNVTFEWVSTFNAVRGTVDLSGYQPLDADLTAIAGLSGTSGFLKKTAANTWTLDATTYAPLASPTFTGTVTLPTSVKIGTLTSTGLVKYTNGVLSIDTSSYKTDYRYRPIKVNGTQQLANTSSTALDFVNTGNVTFEWVSASNGVKATVDLSGYQPLNANLTGISNVTNPAGFLKCVNSVWTTGSLAASDIPNLDASKITSGTFADARIASASTWNAKYTKPSGGIPASDLAESYILTSAKAAANGVASLDANGKVPTSQLPSSVTGGMQYKGTFNATSGSTISGLDQGWYYVCATAGSKNPDGTAFSDGYEIGDWAVYNGSSAGWAKIDNSDHVTSVCGKTGAVTLTASDVGITVTSTSVSDGTNTFNKYTHPAGSGASKSSGLYKFSTDSTSHISGVTAVVKADLTALGVADNSLVVHLAGAETITGNKTFNAAATFNAMLSVNFNDGTNTYYGPKLNTRKSNVLFLETYSGSGATGINLSSTNWSGGSSHGTHLEFLADGTITGDTNDGFGLNTYLQFPSNKGTSSDYATLATLDDIPTITCYTEQEALAILNGTAS